MVNIIGMGYIGLPTALMLANNGVKVIGTDINPEVVNKLKLKKIKFNEFGMKEIFDRALNCEIQFSTKVVKSDIYIVAVPTPYDSITKSVNPQYVVNAVESIVGVCDTEAILIIESTISPGTIERYIRPILKDLKEKQGKKVHVVHAPERIIPGNMIDELQKNSRVIGADNSTIGYKVKNLYESFCKGEIILTDIKTAEMAKVVENTYRDINIAFANELAKICRTENMDVYEVIRIANMHPRVNILQPGPGVGGHCISVDPWFLVGDYPDLANVIKTARETNDSMPRFVYSRIKNIMNENKIDSFNRVGLYGLTYKENVDDLRESPTLQLMEIFKKHGGSDDIKLYDPYVDKKLYGGQCTSFNEFITGIDVIVILVGHDQILKNIGEIKNKIVLDTRNVVKNGSKLYKL